MKIMIVEDNLLNMELAVDLLEVAGYEVLQVTNAMDGISVATTQRLDLILMDLGLPGMNGLEAAKILKGDPITNSIPILAFTAHSTPTAKAMVIKSGCDGYISKPIDTRQFVRTIETYLHMERPQK